MSRRKFSSGSHCRESGSSRVKCRLEPRTCCQRAGTKASTADRLSAAFLEMKSGQTRHGPVAPSRCNFWLNSKNRSLVTFFHPDSPPTRAKLLRMGTHLTSPAGGSRSLGCWRRRTGFVRPVAANLVWPVAMHALLARERFESEVAYNSVSNEVANEPYEVYRCLRDKNPVHGMRRWPMPGSRPTARTRKPCCAVTDGSRMKAAASTTPDSPKFSTPSRRTTRGLACSSRGESSRARYPGGTGACKKSATVYLTRRRPRPFQPDHRPRMI